MNHCLSFFILFVFFSLTTPLALKDDSNHDVEDDTAFLPPSVSFLENPKTDDSNASSINEQYKRQKRYLGLSKRYKLNRRYAECVGPGDAEAHCKHLTFCPMDVLGSVRNVLDYLCVIEKMHVGVCCPDDIAQSGLSGSQIVMDLPAGGYDYEDGDNTTGCGIPAEGRSVVATKRASIQEWPWIVALYRPTDIVNGRLQQFCGGALITDKHVLTAAHCTQGLRVEEIRVRLGEYDFRMLNETRSVDFAVHKIYEHENYVSATYENDIAIITMDKTTSFNSYMWPICLPPVSQSFENEMAVVAGWGRQFYAGPLSPVLLQVAVPVWVHDKCVDAFLERITENNICASAYEGGKDACEGDSGGPLMYQLENGRWVTIGIVSWGIGCGTKGNPGIYTKVNNYLPWIVKNTIAK